MQLEEIEIYDKRQKMTTNFHVVKLSENTFRLLENCILNNKLTFGTEFETRINIKGKHEIIQITKESEFSTRNFFLTSQFKESEYRLLGDEIMKKGGFWQVDLGSIATVNLPKNCDLDIDEIFKLFNFNPVKIVD